MAAGFLEKKMAERDFFMLRPYCINFSKIPAVRFY